MKKFDIGDIVRLKSGGPIMTVKGYSPIINIASGDSESQTEVVCIFKNNGKIITKRFHQDMLILVID